MVQMKYTILVSALAAASLLAAGCEQRSSSGEKVGQATPPGSSAPTSSPDSSNKPALMAQNDQAKSGSAQSQGASPQSDSTMQKAGKVADDGMITLKVKAALLAEPGLKSSQIDVATKDATVTLTGTVDSGALRDRAKQIALATEGVKDVVDSMNLKTTS